MLNKKWKELVYALTPFGANFVMIMMMAYYTDAIDPRLLSADKALWSFNGTTIVAPIVFGVLWTIGRVFDGFIDVPFASVTDRMKNRYMRVKLPIMIGTGPMILGFLGCMLPFTGAENSVFNTIWFFFMAILFFAFYTLNLIAFYGSLSAICTDKKQRQRISSYKAIIDTVIYSVAYALVPLILKGLSINVMYFMAMCAPLMLTIIIPLFLFRQPKDAEGHVPTPEEKEDEEIQKVNIFQSIWFVFKNRVFWSWLIVNGISFFGLQMFLAAQNALISGVLNLSMTWAAVLNTAAFGPVPLMIFIMYKLINKKGIRFAFQIALLCFAVGIMGFFFASELFWGDSIGPKLAIACAGGTIASFAIGAFFAAPLMIPSQVAAVELKVTKRNNSAMYFAGQAVVTSVLSAISTGVLYASIKGITTTTASGYVAPLGGLLVPIIVAACCLLAFGFTFLMPKDYNLRTIAKYFDKDYVVTDEEASKDEGRPALVSVVEGEVSTSE